MLGKITAPLCRSMCYDFCMYLLENDNKNHNKNAIIKQKWSIFKTDLTVL